MSKLSGVFSCLFLVLVVPSFSFAADKADAPQASKEEVKKVKKAKKEKRRADYREWKARQTELSRQRRQFIAGGSIMYVPTDGNLPVRGGFHGNLSFLYAEYILGSGGSVNLYPRIRIGSRVEFHLLGFGATFYHGNPMSVPWIQRRWDINFRSGIDIRIWKWIELRAGAAWFVPNPIVIKNRIAVLVNGCKDDVENAVDSAEGANANQDGNLSEENGTRVATDAMSAEERCRLAENEGKDFLDDIMSSLKRPSIFISVGGVFDLVKSRDKK
ncbi:hypothetical protein JW899_03385 [Candidatus Uhrbacteria bacterium]|nr:hypothetical protein [Candidatus Uhrbacteria bacterium]